MAIVTLQELEDAAADALTLEEVVNGAASPGTVTSRLGTELKTLARLQAEAQGELSYATLDDADALRAYTRGAGVASVVLLGRAAPFDGLGALWGYDAGSSDPDDGVTVLVGADGARWRLLGRGFEWHDVNFSAGYRVTAGSPVLNATSGLLEFPATGTVELDLAMPLTAALQRVRLRVKGSSTDAEVTLSLARRRDAATVVLVPPESGGDTTSWADLVVDTRDFLGTPYVRENPEDLLVIGIQWSGTSGTVQVSKIDIETT